MEGYPAAPTCGPPAGCSTTSRSSTRSRSTCSTRLPRIRPAAGDLRPRRALLGRVDPGEPRRRPLEAARPGPRARRSRELKAQGMEYDERMEELEKVEYPKPNRDFVYATFNEFAAQAPLGGPREHPAQVGGPRDGRAVHDLRRLRRASTSCSARRGCSCATCPRPTRRWCRPCRRATATTSCCDVIAFLRTTVRGVDSSLLDEWERLRDPAYQARLVDPARGRPAALGPPPIWADPRAFAARLRNELHALLVALARKDPEAAAAALATRRASGPPRSSRRRWRPTGRSTRASTSPRPRAGRTTPSSRRPAPAAGRRCSGSSTRRARWTGSLHCEVDSRASTTPEQPLIRLVSIGT